MGSPIVVVFGSLVEGLLGLGVVVAGDALSGPVSVQQAGVDSLLGVGTPCFLLPLLKGAA